MAKKFSITTLSGLGEKLGFNNPRPPLEGYYVYALLFFIGMLIADLGTTYIRGSMLPVGGITRSKVGGGRIGRREMKPSVFTSVKNKNIFNADHVIPDSLGEKQSGDSFEDNSLPTKTTLPLELVGTIIHGRHERSVATIQVRGKDIHAVREEEEIEGMAKIREVTRYKVIFRNLRDQKLEYVEIKEDNKIKMGVAGATSTANLDDSEQTSFTFQRSEINKYLNNLPQVLQDAKAVPYVIPGSGGEIGGFKLVAIKAGSIYEKLGLKRGDILKEVNGEPVDSPQRAMELYQALRSADDIDLGITRNGSSKNLNYRLE